MTTILYKDGQFQTEYGIPFEDQNKIAVVLSWEYHCRVSGGYTLANFVETLNTDVDFKSIWTLKPIEGSTYSIREKVEIKSISPHPDCTKAKACTNKIDGLNCMQHARRGGTSSCNKGYEVARIIEGKEESEEQNKLLKAFHDGVDAAISTLGLSSNAFFYPADYNKMSEWMSRAKQFPPKEYQNP